MLERLNSQTAATPSSEPVARMRCVVRPSLISVDDAIAAMRTAAEAQGSTIPGGSSPWMRFKYRSVSLSLLGGAPDNSSSRRCVRRA